MSIAKYFEKSIKSPEGKDWPQDMWLNAVKGTDNTFGNPNGKTDNGNEFSSEIDFTLKTSESGKSYTKGSLTLGETLFDVVLYPTDIPTFKEKKFQGSVRVSGSKDSVADIDIISFEGRNGRAYKMRLKTPFVATGHEHESIVADEEPHFGVPF
jgi:hypothetical protein